jgi:hypothetical protein
MIFTVRKRTYSHGKLHGYNSNCRAEDKIAVALAGLTGLKGRNQ